MASPNPTINMPRIHAGHILRVANHAGYYDKIHTMTNAEKELTRNYPEAPVIEALADSVWHGGTVTVKMEFAVSLRLKAEILRLSGNELQTVFITDSDIRHIKKQHGQGEARRGQADITPEDFALIPVVLNEFDKVEHTETDRKGNKKFLFTKKIGGIVYLATIERGPHKGEVRTLWKMP